MNDHAATITALVTMLLALAVGYWWGWGDRGERKEKKAMQPTVGRIVIYQTIADHDTSASKACAAIVTAVKADGRVCLKVFDEYDLYKRDVAQGDPGAPGCWSWPPRV